jgi:hypothetical protein
MDFWKKLLSVQILHDNSGDIGYKTGAWLGRLGSYDMRCYHPMAPLLAEPINDNFKRFVQLNRLPEAPWNGMRQKDDLAGSELP